ncbi:MAG TPA: hypothetical protein VJ796_09420 [Acidimicrobiia bacterium]|nr:hypothetical protein [Acidimicrobiia bacterium]
MSEVKMGGKPILSILAVGGQELIDVLLAKSDGGTKLDKGLPERATDRFGDRFRIEVSNQTGVTLGALADWTPSAEGPDVILISTLPDVIAPGRIDLSALHEDGKAAIRALKGSGGHLVFMNVSTVEPNDFVSSYHGLTNDTPSLRAHKVALTLIDLSYQHGVSIIDADRLLAEMGAERHVEAIGRYSAEASEVICDEVLRVLADYGFFEERPLVVQAGRGGS